MTRIARLALVCALLVPPLLSLPSSRIVDPVEMSKGSSTALALARPAAASAGTPDYPHSEIPMGRRLTGSLSPSGPSVRAYHVPLRAGQKVSLTLSAGANTDFGLEVWKNGATGGPVQQVAHSGYPQTIAWEVPASGSCWYDIIVFDRRGSGNFTLDYDLGDSASPPPGGEIRRVEGSSRYETAINVSRSSFATASTVVLATGTNFADALAASGLCGSYGAPLLLTGPDTLSAGVLQEVRRLGSTSVIIVGSPAAIGNGVRNQLLGAGITTMRIGGISRYETASLIAAEIARHEVSLGRESGTDVFLASGGGFADALAVSPYAYSRRIPILLTTRDQLPQTTVSAIASVTAAHVYVVGGEGVVSAGVYDRLPAGKDRIAGSNRYGTAVAAANLASVRGWGSWSHVGMATAVDFPDGLSGGVATGRQGGLLLLSNPQSNRFLASGVTRDTWDALAGRSAGEVSEITVFGGRVAVSGCARQDAALAAWGDSGRGVPWDGGALSGPDKIFESSQRSPWPGQWVWTPTSSKNQWVALRKTVTLPSAPSLATARIAVDSKYWLWVNGQLVVFEGGLKRGPNPRDTYYDTVDLAPYLKAGKNVIAVLAWHFGKSGFSHNDSGQGGFLLQSDISCDGRLYAVQTDGSWAGRVHPGYRDDTAPGQPNARLAESNIYYDEGTGAHLDGWLAPDYEDAAWPRATAVGRVGAHPWNSLVARRTPQVRFTGYKEYENASSLPSVSPGGVIKAKLPSNLQITPVLTVEATGGTVIGIQTDHYTDGAELNVRATYVTKQGRSTFESLGWMSGTEVRYRIPAGVRIVSLAYRESGYDTDMTGGFSSSDPFLTALWRKGVRTLYLNMRDSWMDCPTRERAQWAADTVNEMQGGMYAFDPSANALTAKWIDELTGWQRPDGGLHSPVPGTFDKELPQQMLTSVWGIWQYYTYSGDRSTVVAAYPSIKSYMDLWTLGADGLVNHRAGDWDWSDWGSDADSRLLDNAWYAMALQSTIHVAQLSGNQGDVPRLQDKLRCIQRNFDGKFWDGRVQAYRSGGYDGVVDDRGNALAVVAGLAPQSRYPALVQALRLQKNASPYMEMYVLRAMYIMGDPVAAEERMHARYVDMVADPGYTLWEGWRKGMGTDDHAWGCGPVFSLSAYAAGLVPTSPGYATYDVQPQLGALNSVSASTVTVRGRLSVAASNETSGYTLSVTAPAGTRGTLVVPADREAELAINGRTIYVDGNRMGSIPGASIGATTAATVAVVVDGGTWTVSSTIRQQPFGMGNSSLISR